MSHPLSDMLGATMSKIRELVDANTIVGSPITTPDGVTLIPVSKVSFGYAGGGSDFTTKHSRETGENPFGGGGGGGVSITPVAFLVVKEGSVRMLPITDAAAPLDRAVDAISSLAEQVQRHIQEKKAAKEEKEA